MPRNYKYHSRVGAFVKKKERSAVNYDTLATEDFAILIAFFREYPDYLEDLCQSDEAQFGNSLISRVIKRAMVRYRQCFIFGTRGIGKTTCVISAASNKGILYPNEVIAYYAPAEKQAAKIASEAWQTYSINYPYLAHHWKINSDAASSFKISTEDGSAVEIDIDRGRNTSCVIAEECAQEEAQKNFDWTEFNQVVKATNRKQHMVNGKPDKSHKDLAEIYITSSSRKENPSYSVCRQIRQKMVDGEDAFACWIPWQVPVLCKMKPYEYYANLKDSLTAEQFMRECESKCTGSIENPIIKEAVLEEAKKVKIMEDKHCGISDVFYIIGYDPSSRDIAGNALCGIAVLKCERQYETAKWDRYKKSLVYVNDTTPPKSAREHAVRIKQLWKRYWLEEDRKSTPPYLIIDARQYGQSVIECLHEDLNDGLPPLCTVTHEEPYNALEQNGAIACIYPLQATGNSGRDPNSVMLDYIEREFENGNMRILTTNFAEGLRAYKLKHNIKNDIQDVYIQKPYERTRELCRQIGNLQKKYTSTGWIESPISRYIVHDMWSATLYAARYAQYLEKDELYALNRADDGWQKAAKAVAASKGIDSNAPIKTRTIRRLGRGATK